MDLYNRYAILLYYYYIGICGVLYDMVSRVYCTVIWEMGGVSGNPIRYWRVCDDAYSV